MAINSDKQLRDKLSNQEFPFDPQAWEQMEALLDKKKKRRGFFWWWTGGIAAVLLLSAGTLGWGLYLMEEDDMQREEIAETRNEKYEIGNTKGETKNTKYKNRNAKLNTTTTEQSELKTENKKQETGKGNSKIEIRNTKLNAGTNAGSELKTVNSKQDLNSASAVINKPSTANRQLSTINRKQKTGHGKLKYEVRNTKLNSATSSYSELETENLKLETVSAQQEGFLLSRQEASLLAWHSDNSETALDKKEEDALPKPKKKIFSYSLGCIAGVSFVTVGKQDWSTNRRIHPKPSYQAGLTNDFLFAQRVALTTGFVFLQTSFVIANPKTTLLDNRMIYYTSKITELAIPVGIKVYPVVKGNFRFYINTGIVNHIKLKETFSYVMSNDTLVANTIVSLADVTTLPAETNFNGNYAPSVSGALNAPTGTADFSINRAKRYYASYYASVGFEYLAGVHWLIFGEPAFNMSLQKIGVQDKRKYNIGLNAGFRYQF